MMSSADSADFDPPPGLVWSGPVTPERGAEVFQGQMTGSGSYSERKQRLFLSSYHGRVKPWGCNHRSAPCARYPSIC